MITTYKTEYDRYKAFGEKAMGQLSIEALNRVHGTGNNSIAMIVRHISGNFASRFTEFLTSDGEKPWRNREAEFALVEYAKEEIDEMWARGWAVLYAALAELRDADLPRTVFIRGQALTVDEALARSLAHVSYHVGQIVVLARIETAEAWNWITIPKGNSAQYNQNPTMEKKLQG